MKGLNLLRVSHSQRETKTLLLSANKLCDIVHGCSLSLTGYPIRPRRPLPMRAILIFNLPKDLHEFQLANEAANWHSVVWEINEKLRGYLKYGHAFKSAEEALQEIRSQLNEEITVRNLEFH